MRLTTKGQYAVRAMVNLACNAVDKPVTLKDISEEEGISQTYLEQLFAKLRQGNVVKSVRGPGGGYILARPASEISVGDVIIEVEEPLNPVSCLDDKPQECDRFETCTTKRVWKGLGDRIKEFLHSVSIEELSIEASATNGSDVTEGSKKVSTVCVSPPN